MSEFTEEYRIAQLLSKKMTGELTPEEKQELQKWEQNSPSAKEIASQVLNPMNKRHRDKFVNSLDLDKSWQKLEKHLPREKNKTRHLIWWTSTAAAILAIAFFFVYPQLQQAKHQPLPIAEIQTGSAKAVLITSEGKKFNLSTQDSSRSLDLGQGLFAINSGNAIEYQENPNTESTSNKRLNTIQVPKGGEYELILPDGTHVWINSDTKLTFPVAFDSNKREVTLAGEAYFDVTKDPKRPFMVKTENIEIKVLGTQFNVQAYPDDNKIETTLCEGSVNVTDGELGVTLTPSQQAVYSKVTQAFTTRKVDVRLYTAWKEGLFVFENKPLEEIMNTLSRWYNINVFYSNQAVKSYHFTGDLERYGDFRKTLNMIEKSTVIRFVINGNNIMVEEIPN